MKKILLSSGLIMFVAAITLSATGAFFSDTETSTGNTFTAGDIDLQIDNESYVTNAAGVLVASPNTSWAMKDLTVEKFFNFADLKPGDIGEDTISIHVGSNSAWMCAAARITDDSDQTCTDPENGDDPTCSNPGLAQGELDSSVNFSFWVDDGDNVLEVGENPFLVGPISGLDAQGKITLADSRSSVLGSNTPIPGGTTFYIAKAWCFGTLTPAPIAQGASTGPLVRGTGFTCDGAAVNNAAQTDRVIGDLQFYAVQSRNNATFTCSQNFTPTWPEVAAPLTVGANFSSYIAPTCNVNVDVSPGGAPDTINLGIAAANPGQTICVTPGTYPEIVNVNKSVTIAGLGAVGSAVVNGGFIIDADNVTVKGLEVTGGNTEGTFAGFYIKSGVDNLTIRDNDVDGPAVNDIGTPGGSRGIANVTGVPISAILVENNTIHEWTSGIYTNPDTGLGITWTIRMNDIDDNIAGIGEVNSALVSRNEFSNTVAAQEAIGAGPSYDAISLISQNNFLSGTMVNTYVSITGDVMAENNFWGPSGGAIQTGGTDEVDFTPEAGVMFAHN